MTPRTFLIGTAAAVVVAGLALSQCSPPALLNALNSATPGDSNAARVGSGIAYGPQPRQLLDVWAPRTSDGKPLPVVIFFYGGAWVKGERGEYGLPVAPLRRRASSPWSRITGWCRRCASRCSSRIRRWR